MPKRYDHRECGKRASYGKAGTNNAELCAEHARGDMVNVVTKRCAHSGCTKHPSFGKADTNKAELCKEHARDGMVNVRMRTRCRHSGCAKRPSYGTTGGSRTGVFCLQHAKETTIDVNSPSSMDGQTASGRGQVGSLGRGIARRVGASEQRGIGAPPPTPAGASSGDQSTGTDKRARHTTNTPLSPTVATAVAAGGGNGRAAVSGIATGRGDVKVKVPTTSCKVELSKAEGGPNFLRAGARAGVQLSSEPGAAVKTEVTVRRSTELQQDGGEVASGMRLQLDYTIVHEPHSHGSCPCCVYYGCKEE